MSVPTVTTTRTTRPVLPVSGAVLSAPDGDSPSRTATLPVGAPALAGHYPGYPIVPGVFLTEIVTAAEAEHRGGLGRWAGVRSVRFRAPVFPGQRVRLERAEDRPRWTVTHEDGTDVAVVDLVLDDAAAARTVAAATVAADGAPASDDTARAAPAQVLPHRPPMLLVDTVLTIEPGASASVAYTITVGAGGADTGPHTPMPWPLVVESWGQAAALLALWDEPSPDVRTGNVLLFGGARTVTFGAAPLPGTTLVHKVELLADAGGATLLTGSTWVGDTQVLEVGQVTLGRRPPGALPEPPEHLEQAGGDA